MHRSLFILVVLFLGLAGTGCTGGTSIAQSELDAARARWGAGLPSYTFRWQQSCECIPEATRPITITVENDAIVDAIYADAEGGAVPASIRDHLATVDGVFDLIQEAIDDDAFRITVEYDPRGVPTNVAIDYDDHTADEELSLRLSNVTAL